MHNPCGGITKAPGVTIGTLATWLQKLPPRIVSDRLVEEYFTAAGFTHWLFSSSHKPSFLLKYRELWSCAHSPPEHNERAPVSLSFFGLVCFVVCTTLQFLPDDLAYLTDNRTAELSAQLHDLGRQALSASEVEDPPDRFRVEAILMDVSCGLLALERKRRGLVSERLVRLTGPLLQTRRQTHRDLLSNRHGCAHRPRLRHAPLRSARLAN